MPLPRAGILPNVQLGLGGPTLAPSRPNLPPRKIPGYPASREQNRRLPDRRRDSRRALAGQNRVLRLHGKNHASCFLTWLALLPALTAVRRFSFLLLHLTLQQVRAVVVAGRS